MNVKIEIDCSAQEARAFLGLPDVEPLNNFIVEEMTRRIETNVNMLQPEEVMKTWAAFGIQAQDHFRKLMAAATTGTTDL